MSSLIHLVILLLWTTEGSSLILTPSSNSISQSGTSNLSMTCSLDEQSGNQPETFLEKAVKMRILKLHTSKWEPVIEMEWTWKSPYVLEGLDGSVSVEENGINYLQVNWTFASNETAGQYACDVIGYTQNQQGTWQRSASIIIHVDTPLTLYQLSKMYQTAMETMSTMQERMEESQKIIDFMSSIYTEEWPQGVYGLYQPKSGCPADVGVIWNTGYRTHTTQSVERNKDEVSSLAYIQTPYMWRSGATKLIRQHFCSVTTQSTGRLWPAGSYCINRYKNENCPLGFEVGHIVWDDEDTGNANDYSGTIPVSQHNTVTVIYYCCRNDKSSQTPIHLPRRKSFYLYRFGGTCQKVAGMQVFPEYILFHTDSGSGYYDVAPDGSNSTGNQNFVKLHLCYYVNMEYWPEGKYGLFQPESGCPANNGVNWKTGHRTHTTKSAEENKDQVSSPAHMKKPVMWKFGPFTLMRQHFCTVTTSSTGTPWPVGSYCINRYRSNNCPLGFDVGNIFWDGKDGENKNDYAGAFPASTYSTDTRMYYCCRNDSTPQTPIHLPRDTAFYLYRYGGTCQEVAGMTVTPEYMRFATDCCATTRTDFTPDGLTTVDRVELQLCHYQSKEKKSQ